MKPYYEIIRDLREDHDLRQAQIARLLKTTQQVYSRYEKGQNEIPLRHLITLAKFYNVSLDYIAGLTSEKRKIGIQNKSQPVRLAFILYSICKKSSRVKRAEIALNPDTKSNKQGFLGDFTGRWRCATMPAENLPEAIVPTGRYCTR